MSDNYVSPYGFGPVMDSLLDCVADRHDRGYTYLAVSMERLPEDVTEELNMRIEGLWTTNVGPAVDALDDLLSEYVDLEHGR